MTRLQIRDMARKRLGETTAAFWTDTELNTWINDAGTDLAFLAKCLRTNSTLTTVESTSEYTLTNSFSDLIAVLEVYLYTDGSTWEKLDPTTRTRLDIEHPGWMSASDGVPNQYYYDREEDILRLYVPPNSDNAGTDYLKVYYVQDYTDLAADTTESGLPTYLHLAQVEFTVAMGLETRGHMDKSNKVWADYYRRVANYKAERNREKEDDDIIMIPADNL